MTQELFDTKRLSRYPTSAGVYLMKDSKGTVLYVGKAKNIKNRLKSYYSLQDGRAQIPHLLKQITEIETIVVHSEKEALLLENTLIKKHQPRYNVLLKDDKGYISLKVSTKHPWPRLALVRFKGNTPKDGTYFGPYTSAYHARQMFDLVNKLFPIRECSDEEFIRRKRPCMLYQIKRCCAPCVGKVSHDEYQGYVDEAMKVIKGENEEVLAMLHRQMQEASDALEFEKAHSLLQKIAILQSIKCTQTVEALSTESADVWALYKHGFDVVLCKLLLRSSKLVGSHHFDFSDCVQEANELLSSFLLQHYLVEANGISEILVYQEFADAGLLSELLSEKLGKKIRIRSPEKGEKKKLVQLAYANAKAIFTQRNDAKMVREKTLLYMQETLSLNRFPKKIECFDNSHISGKEPVSACICFVNGEKYTKGYRKYKMKVGTGDDYAMMHESLTRHLVRAKESDALSDLIIIDGGLAHLRVAMRVLQELEIISCDVIAVAKEGHRHDKGLSLEKIYTQNTNEPIVLARDSELLFFIQNIRDEAHRFVLAYQTLRRKKSTIKSLLDEIPGIGPKKKKKLLLHFKNIKSIAEASEKELQAVSGISQRDAIKICEFFINHQSSLKDSSLRLQSS